MAKKTMAAEERKAMREALKDIRKECGMLMDEVEEYDLKAEDYEALAICEELGF